MRGYSTLDLSTLPPPDAVEQWSFDVILDDSRANFLSYWSAAREKNPALPMYDVDRLKGNPVNFALSAGAYREGLLRQRVNEAVRAVMLAYAEDADLDNLAALIGLARRVIAPPDPTAVPPTPAAMEENDEFRARIPIALDSTAIGLVGGGYKTIVLQAEPAVKAVALVHLGGGRLDVILQGRGADGTVADDVAARVNDRLQADDGGQLTDIVSARSARPKPYRIVADALVPPGPALAPVQIASGAALANVVAVLQAIGRSVPTDALIAAGRVPPMIKFALREPAEDLAVAADEVSWCTSIVVHVAVANG